MNAIAPRRLRVLVVDDDEDTRMAIGRAIERWDHDVVLASDGVEALSIHRKRPADVIVSDWQMPNMSGAELCERARAGEADDRYTYFVFVTGDANRSSFTRGVEVGADAFLTKPVDLEELRARLFSASRVSALQRRLSDRTRRAHKDSRANFVAARTDALTEVPNRLRLREDLEALRARGARYGHRYAIALCDLDHFKAFNDHHGHLAGDDALRRAARCIREHLRSGDTVYRYGGEEFLVVLPEQTVAEGAAAIERVRCSLQDLAIAQAPGGGSPVLTMSAGVAELTPADGMPEEWVARADAALYEAKAHGRNRVVPGAAEIRSA